MPGDAAAACANALFIARPELISKPRQIMFVCRVPPSYPNLPRRQAERRPCSLTAEARRDESLTIQAPQGSDRDRMRPSGGRAA